MTYKKFVFNYIGILGSSKTKIKAFITDYQAVDRTSSITSSTCLSPSGVSEQVALMAAEERAEYF
jgi:hypothetical protein